MYSSVIQVQKKSVERKELPFVGNFLYLIQNVEFQGITGLEWIILLCLSFFVADGSALGRTLRDEVVF